MTLAFETKLSVTWPKGYPKYNSYKIPLIKTPRLVLRGFEMKEAYKVQELLNLPEIAPMIGSPYPYTVEIAFLWISTHEIEAQNGKKLSFAITAKKTKELIGSVSLSLHPENKKAVLGWWLGKEYWHQGFAREAVQAVIALAFEQLGLHRLEALARTDNQACLKLMKALGMKEEGLFKDHYLYQGLYYDTVQYALVNTRTTA